MAQKAAFKELAWIGLTGGIATGKSTVSGLIRAHGIPVVDADELAREVIRPQTKGLQQVVSLFGPDVLAADGSLDRARMGQIVFRDRQKLDQLENIIHPLIRERVEELKRELRGAGHRIAIYDVPLLFEKNMESLFDGVIVVACGFEQQLQRFIARNGVDEVTARARIAQQLPIEDKVKRADWIVDNSGSKAQLEKNVKVLLEELKEKFS